MTASEWANKLRVIVGAADAGDPAPLEILSGQLAEMELAALPKPNLVIGRAIAPPATLVDADTDEEE